jgi:hypothetical protein
LDSKFALADHLGSIVYLKLILDQAARPWLGWHFLRRIPKMNGGILNCQTPVIHLELFGKLCVGCGRIGNIDM